MFKKRINHIIKLNKIKYTNKSHTEAFKEYEKLKSNNTTGLTGIWKIPKNIADYKSLNYNTIQSSNLWNEATPRFAISDIPVTYAGGIVFALKNYIYYIDNSGRILVGYHGSTSPPQDINGNELCGNYSHKYKRINKRI